MEEDSQHLQVRYVSIEAGCFEDVSAGRKPIRHSFIRPTRPSNTKPPLGLWPCGDILEFTCPSLPRQATAVAGREADSYPIERTGSFADGQPGPMGRKQALSKVVLSGVALASSALLAACGRVLVLGLASLAPLPPTRRAPLLRTGRGMSGWQGSPKEAFPAKVLRGAVMFSCTSTTPRAESSGRGSLVPLLRTRLLPWQWTGGGMPGWQG
jgi:hypothetical protein